jgi:hypothetical protein
MQSIRENPVWYVLAAVLVFACTWMGPGAAISLRHFGIPFVLIAAGFLFAPRLRGMLPAAAHAAPALPALMLFMVLVGAGGMVNHGALFAAMSHDFWHADLLVAPDRRPVLPAIAATLPPWPFPYAVVWYGCFAGVFLAAWTYLAAQRMAAWERFSVLTASILAYLLIIPGYTEVLTFLVALLCWRAELTTAEKCIAAAVMIGGHEVAGAFALAFLAIEAAGADRRAWLGIGVFLYVVYAAGYAFSAGAGLMHDLGAATRPFAGHPMSAWQLDEAHPWRCLLGILAAFKLLWLLVPLGLLQPGRTRLHAACVVAALPLVLVAVDTSRIVQFATLSLFAMVAGIWPRLAPNAGRALALGTLVLPSICAGTPAIPAWGKGLYAIYALVAQHFGISLGGMAF